jgi:DNA-binding response OmpR family regulator
VIVLVLMMPVLDGWGFRARQLAEAAWAVIPVVGLSAARHLNHHAGQLAAAAVIEKPSDLDLGGQRLTLVLGHQPPSLSRQGKCQALVE